MPTNVLKHIQETKYEIIIINCICIINEVSIAGMINLRNNIICEHIIGVVIWHIFIKNRILKSI